MTTRGEGLVPFSEAEAAIEPFVAGGIIEHALSAPEASMDRIVSEHLGTVAALNARGDTVQERPTYVFNPDSGLLINYAFRRDHNPARQGFFADIVELDSTGNPRHGVEVVNPFQTQTGFINVAVGENNKGFAPSSVSMKMEDNDPTTVVPPNIEMADLLTMLQGEPIPDDMTIDEFLSQQHTTEEEMRARTERRQQVNYLPTMQALDEQTDPNLHLIITDRDDVSALEAASRSVGTFPIVLTAREIVEAAHKMAKMKATENVFDRISTFVAVRNGDNTRSILESRVPAFMTYDFRGGADREIPFPEPDSRPVMPLVAVSHLLEPYTGNGPERGVLRTSPIFSRILSENRYVEDPPDPVKKVAHGKYEVAIDPDEPAAVSMYTAWLRKARLDYALTLYLRGLSQL